MTAAAADPIVDEASDLEASVDLIIASCEGDARAAVRALIVANSFLEQDLEHLRASISTGYVRGRFDRLPARSETLSVETEQTHAD